MSLDKKLQALPAKPGVYLFKNRLGEIIYVGKAKSLRRRVTSYFKKTDDLKTSVLLSRLADIDYIVVGSETDALLLEADLIKKYHPRYNILMRDDKAYPYLKLTVNEEWPRLLFVRRKAKDGALYFGRFEGAMARDILRLIKKLFPIRWCKETPLRKREQPCLYYRIGACASPCTGRISRTDYLALVKGIRLFLEGKMAGALAKLQAEMAQASRAQEYERAAAWRDRIEALTKLMAAKKLEREPAPRLLAELNELKELLNLTTLPMRIEAFDISNISGSNNVGAMVAFYGGVPLKSDYRKFKIYSVTGKPNDTASMAEVIRRRYGGELAKKLPRPDLVLIDGGLPQVNAAAKIIKDIALIGLAKREEEIYWPRQFRPLKLSKNSPALKLLQRIRDEAHRFAVTFHRQKRSQGIYPHTK